MPAEHSAGAIIIRREAKRAESLVLLIHAKPLKTEYWDLPKGNIEAGEKAEATAEREAKEETGIRALKPFSGFKERVSWFYRREGQNIFKTVTYFLFETDQKEVTPQLKEILDAEWFTIDEAIEKVTFKRSKDVLAKAKAFIAKREKEGLGRFM